MEHYSYIHLNFVFQQSFYCYSILEILEAECMRLLYLDEYSTTDWELYQGTKILNIHPCMFGNLYRNENSSNEQYTTWHIQLNQIKVY